MSAEDETPDFASLLEPDFRWPTAGDKAFTVSDVWHDNSSIDRFGHGRIVMMIDGYKMAADLMVAQVGRSRHDGDVLVFPIIFNYRQFIELSLKYLISTYGRTVGVPPNWSTHDLTTLWATFEQVLEGYQHEDADGTDGVVAGIIGEFAKLDPQSFALRYPVDKKGKPIALAFDEVDLQGLAKVMKGLEGYFSGCDGYLDALQSAGP